MSWWNDDDDGDREAPITRDGRVLRNPIQSPPRRVPDDEPAPPTSTDPRGLTTAGSAPTMEP